MWFSAILLIAITPFNFINGSVLMNGFDPAKFALQTNRIDLTYGNWQKFYFTNNGSYSMPSFRFTSSNFVCIILIDMYCAGDTFELFIDGVSIGTSLPVSTTCETSCTDPANCNYPMYSRYASAESVNINSTLDISVINSPYSAGAAAVLSFIV